MTKQEAMVNLEVIREYIDKPTLEIKEGIAITSLTAGIEALEKQIPRKVKNIQESKNFNGNIYSFRGDCPICGSARLLSNNTDYCNACGQKLDWN